MSDLPEFDLANLTRPLGHKRAMTTLALLVLDNSIGSVVETLNNTGALRSLLQIITPKQPTPPLQWGVIKTQFQPWNAVTLTTAQLIRS